MRESKGGTSSLSFDYRIVAKRRGYEKERLTDVTERFNAEKAQAMPPVHPGIEHGPLPQPHSPVLMEGPVTPAKIPAAAESPLLGAPHSHRTPIPLPGVHPVVRKTAAGHPESTTHP